MRSTSTRAGTYLWLGLLGIIFVAPLAWMVSTSLKSPNEMANPDLNLLPREPTLESYEKILGQSQTPVFQWFVNSILAATLQTVLILITASMAAYALARMQFPGRRLMTGLVLVTLFVPPISLVIPNYLIVDQIGWVDSLAAVIVPGAAGAFGVFFLRQFFLSLPKELEEAAIIDGAGKFRVFWQVIIPLSKPALATLALLSFLTNWNDFLWPLYVLVSPENLTLQPGLSTLQSAYQTDYAAMMAGGVIASVPVLLLFVATQRFVVEGVSRSGLKG
ncbi:MAG TPA: carbohydrate ABC transporter permease [Candidatus Limnocylindria bacterium]|nr:carbohydrate ABC transporter permease [Candidatus Limnocylindria bacterium]